MDSKNEIIDANYSLDILIADSIELILYAKQITAKQITAKQITAKQITAKQITAKQVNLVQLMTYYSLGKWIVE